MKTLNSWLNTSHQNKEITLGDLSRRHFIKLLAKAGATTAIGSLWLPGTVSAKHGAHVVVIGGGFGGSVCAKYIKLFDSSIDVTLIESNKNYITCPFSNTVLAGINKIDFITHSYEQLAAKYGINIMHSVASDIDPVNKKVVLQDGKRLHYDRLVVSPGIDFCKGQTAIKDCDNEIMPHAWKAGYQTLLLRKQLVSMKNGGVFVIAPPPKPFRGPPAPYERASLIAHYFKKNKPKSKILIIDPNDSFAKQELFMNGWEKLYPGMIEWIKDSPVKRADNKTMEIFTASGESYKGDVINLIPSQQAGTILEHSGLTEKNGWCNVNQKTFESSKQKDVYVIGDSSVAGDMPKTGHAANSQAKICAAAIVSDLDGNPMPEPSYSSSIYSLLGPKYAISLANVYRLSNGKISKVSGGDSPLKAKKKFRLKEAKYAAGWYKSITADMFS